MVKLIDVDKLFDEYIEDYVYSNIGKVKPEEIENKIPQLYVKFGDEKLKQLDGKTPNTYYKQFSGVQLLECLKAHLEQGVSVSDFLCEAITENKENESAVILELNNENGEEYTVYLMNMVLDGGFKVPTARYLEFITLDYGETIRELATEQLLSVAESVKEEVLTLLNETQSGVRANLVEILSNCKNDDRVFDILVAEFAKHQENIPLYAGYLAKYGDERALPFLTVAIEKEKISYADFEELRFAIEALGGSYDKERDFSRDKSFKKIESNQN